MSKFIVATFNYLGNGVVLYGGCAIDGNVTEFIANFKAQKLNRYSHLRAVENVRKGEHRSINILQIKHPSAPIVCFEYWRDELIDIHMWGAQS